LVGNPESKGFSLLFVEDGILFVLLDCEVETFGLALAVFLDVLNLLEEVIELGFESRVVVL
jgi:hypothetical protein